LGLYLTQCYFNNYIKRSLLKCLTLKNVEYKKNVKMSKDIYLDESELAKLARDFKLNGGRSYPVYSKAYKQMVVRKILVNHEKVTLVSENLRIPRQTIYHWISIFAEGNGTFSKLSKPRSANVEPKTMPMPRHQEKPVETPEQELARLREENKKLQEALKMAEWSNHAKDVMIDLAEKTFNIPIRKKSGAKQ